VRTIRRAPWRQKVLWVILGTVFAAGALAVLVPYFGGTWVVYFFMLAPFVEEGRAVLLELLGDLVSVYRRELALAERDGVM
jgi:hypothetical protein